MTLKLTYEPNVVKPIRHILNRNTKRFYSGFMKLAN